MFSVESNSIIYILSTYNNTGGPRSLHQLCHALNNNGYDARIVYSAQQKDSLFKEYNIKVDGIIKDDPKNILIVPETMTYVFNRFINIRKIIWWLSLDYYINSTAFGNAKYTSYLYHRPKIFIPIEAIYKRIRYKQFSRAYKPLSINAMKNVYHLYNCEYVHGFLKENGIDEKCMHYLCGPLEKIFLDADKESICKNKMNIVVYNPAKIDLAFLGKIKKLFYEKKNNVDFVAIQNMSRDEVFNTLSKAKLYIDFGCFPGPERMPREAVMLFCNIITSNLGSAQNEYDVPISKEHKFKIIDNNTNSIVELMIEMIDNYNHFLKYGDEYREKIKSQILHFDEYILDIFSNN